MKAGLLASMLLSSQEDRTSVWVVTFVASGSCARSIPIWWANHHSACSPPSRNLIALMVYHHGLDPVQAGDRQVRKSAAN